MSITFEPKYLPGDTVYFIVELYKGVKEGCTICSGTGELRNLVTNINVQCKNCNGNGNFSVSRPVKTAFKGSVEQIVIEQVGRTIEYYYGVGYHDEYTDYVYRDIQEELLFEDDPINV